MGIKKTKDTMTPSINDMIKGLDKVPRKTADRFRKETPKDTGNARRKTKLQGNKIRARYKYAKPLDKGHSKQAPKGMYKPTEDFFIKLIEKIMRK